VDNQIEKLTHTATDQGWKYKIFDDRGYSGAKFDRPELQKMFSLVKNKQIERVLIWKIDRLSRKLSHLLNILELFEANDVELISVSENFDINTPVGKLLLGMLGSVAEFERDSIIQRIKAIKNTRKRVKRLPLGNPPYGLVMDKNRGMLVQDNGLGCELIRRIFDLANDGIGAMRIAEYLNNNGFKTKLNRRFDSSTVGRMLNNPTYAGMIEIDGNLEKGNIEPIIDFDAYMKVQGAMQRRRYQNRSPASKHLLTGLLKCSVCGSGLVSSGHYAEGKRFYRCGRKAGEGMSACTLKSLHADKIETDITSKLVDVVLKDRDSILEEMFKKEKEYNRKAKETKENIKRLESSIRRDENSINTYFEMFETDFIDKEDLKKRIDTVKENIKTQGTELFDLKLSLVDLNPLEMRRRYEAALNSFQLVFELADLRERRNLFKIIVNRIDAYDDHLDVYLKSGYSFRVDYERKKKRFTRTLNDWEINTLKGIDNKKAKAVVMACEGMAPAKIAHALNVDISKVTWTLKTVNKKGIATCFEDFRDNQSAPFEEFLFKNIDSFRYLSFRNIMKGLEKAGFSPSYGQLKNFWYRNFKSKT